MNYFLAKTDPETYSIDDLARDRKTVWDGVRNAQALRRHSGDAARATGCSFITAWATPASWDMAKVASAPRPDPKDAKLTVVDFEFLHKLEPPTTLHEIKESGLFADWALVRQSRLSTMSVPRGICRVDAEAVRQIEDLKRARAVPRLSTLCPPLWGRLRARLVACAGLVGPLFGEPGSPLDRPGGLSYRPVVKSI